MARSSVMPIINEAKLPEVVLSEQVNLSQKKLARLRAIIKATRHEFIDKFINEIQDCRKCINNVQDAIGECDVATKLKNE